MKIISKYKDYYDAGLVYGIDEKIFFKREQKIEEIEVSLEGFIISFNINEILYKVTIYPGIMGFCSNFFTLYSLFIEKNNKGIIIKEKEIVYEYQDFKKFFEKLGGKFIEQKVKYGFSKKEETLIISSKLIDLDLSKINLFLKGYYQTYGYNGEKIDFSEYTNIFYEEKIAYFILEIYDYYIEKNTYFNSIKWKKHFIANPILKDYKFSKIKDAYKTFQEISMFLGNLNNPNEKMIKTEDKYLAYSKGFDCYSFKKRASKKENKQCSKKRSLD